MNWTDEEWAEQERLARHTLHKIAQPPLASFKRHTVAFVVQTKESDDSLIMTCMALSAAILRIQELEKQSPAMDTKTA